MVMVRMAAALLALVLAIAPAAQAQDWPNRPIRFIVPYPAGGSTDVGARVIADHLARSLGQQIVVENRSGGSGNIGFEAGARAAPDGYTVLIAPDQVASAPHVFKVSFDPLKDLLPSSSCRGSRSYWPCTRNSAWAPSPSWSPWQNSDRA